MGKPSSSQEPINATEAAEVEILSGDLIKLEITNGCIFSR